MENPKLKKTVSFDVETGRRLAAYAGLMGRTESDIVVELVKARLETFRAFDTKAATDDEERRPARQARTPGRQSA